MTQPMNLRNTLILAAATVLTASTVFAETLKEGRITFEISLPMMNGEEVDEQMKAMMPYESVQYYKGNKSRNEMKAGFGSTVTLMEQGKDTMILLMDMMGMKNLRRMPLDDPKRKTSEQSPDIRYTEETKKVAGYTCKKAVITVKSEEGESVQLEAWVAEDLEVPVQGHPDFKSLKGVALEFDFKMREMSMHMKATKVEKIPVSDDLFTIPEGYKEGPMFPGTGEE